MRKILLLLTIFAALSSARFISGSIPMSQIQKDKHAYLTKFSIAKGIGILEIRFKFSKPIKAESENFHTNLAVYIDPNWDQFIAETDCEKKLALKQDILWMWIPVDGSWGEIVKPQFQNIVRTHVWFFELFDCEGSFSKLDPNMNILWEATLYNSDGSHFSDEEHGVLSLKLWILGIFVVFCAFNITKFYHFYKTEEIFDYPGLCLIIILFMEFWSLIFDIIHLSYMESDGVGSYFFNFSSAALSVVSQYCLTCVLLLLANGWSFRYMGLDHIKSFSPGAVLLGIIHIFLMWLGTSSDNEHDKFHDFENWSGVLIILIRVACFAFFIYLLKHTYSLSEAEDKKFLKLFGFCGTIYFLAFPILVLISSAYVARYLRHKVITIGSLFFLITVMMFLTKMFTSKKNKFYNNLLDVQKMLEVEVRDNKLFADLSA